MTRFMLPSLALVLLGFAAHASAQDTKAADAQKQLGDIQKALAGGADLQKRLRIDTFESGDGQIKIAGVFLDAPPVKSDDPPLFDAMQDEVGKLLRDRLKDAALKFNWSGITKIEPKDHPHAVLQTAANAAGAKGEPAADRVLFAGSRFGADGEIILSGQRAKGDDTAKWVSGAITAHLAKNPAVKGGTKPLVSDELKAVEWKLTAGEVQRLFAASDEAPTRRLRADRVYLALDPESGVFHATLEGVRLGEDAVNAEAIPDLLRKQWPDLFTGAPRVLVNLKPLLGPGVPEPAAQLQSAVAAKPLLDGVRIDSGAEFSATGELMLTGLQPGLTAAGEKDLIALYEATLKELSDKGDATAARYKRLAAGGVSVKGLKPVATKKLLTELRAWTANAMDDARLSRLYFGADGGLKLQVKTVTKADSDKIRTKFKELTAKHLPTVQPELATEASTFGASFAVHLRKEMASDQKKWNGVLIERGYFDAANGYALRGVVDQAAQNDDLAKLLDGLKADPRWAEYFTPVPAKPALEVVPLSELVARVQRVTPAYPQFDGIRIESAEYDASVNLIFKATVVGKPDGDPAALLAKLLRDDPTFKRRAPADKQVKLVRAAGADAPGPFSVAEGAALLAGKDTEKAKAWLDRATLHYPGESGVWYLSAFYHFRQGDTELARRDLYRMIELEGPLEFNGTARTKRRYEAAKPLQGKERNDLDALWLAYLREVKDGAKRMTMTKEK